MKNTMVLSVGHDKKVVAVNDKEGIFEIRAKAVILAMGCRERPRGALNIPGTRPAGIYTAGTAQKYVNIEGFMPGKNVVILGSGDIGLIMARRMTLEGAKVHAVCEIMPYSGGLTRNIEQCLNDFDIPLLLSHTIINIHGKNRLEGVTMAKVNDKRKPIEGTEQYIECDTLLLSVGLLPENELTEGAGIEIDKLTGGAFVDGRRETSCEGIFACGNVLHVHDLVDYVSEEAEIAGKAAALYIKNGKREKTDINVFAEGFARYTVPQRITSLENTRIYFRVSEVIKNAIIVVNDGSRVMLQKKKQKCSPGEMETIELTKEIIESVESGRIIVSVLGVM